MSKKQSLSYKEAYSRLEDILTGIQSGSLDVDELSQKIKEASELIKLCKNKLFKANEETKKIIDELEV